MVDVSAGLLVGRTREGLERLFDALDAFDAGTLRLELAGGWTVSALLAHLAFWDTWVHARWAVYDELGRFDRLPDYILDLVNAAAMPGWLAVPPADAVKLARSAATDVTRRIQGLSDEAAQAALEGGRPAMLDRTVHWQPHLDEITSAVSDQTGFPPARPPAQSG